jgi:hypothetical protein
VRVICTDENTMFSTTAVAAVNATVAGSASAFSGMGAAMAVWWLAVVGGVVALVYRRQKAKAAKAGIEFGLHSPISKANGAATAQPVRLLGTIIEVGGSPQTGRIDR